MILSYLDTGFQVAPNSMLYLLQILLQDFITRFYYKILLQDFITDFITRFYYKILLQDFTTRSYYKILLHEFIFRLLFHVKVINTTRISGQHNLDLGLV